MTPIELRHLIKDKCDAWLNPMGYTLHHSTSTYLVYSNDEIIYSDAFKECTFVDGTPFGIREE